MKKKPLETKAVKEMRAEYDFRGGVRGKHHKAMRQGYSVRIRHADGSITENHYQPEDAITLEPDVREYFPDSASVNHALRTLIALVPSRTRAAVGRKQPRPTP